MLIRKLDIKYAARMLEWMKTHDIASVFLHDFSKKTLKDCIEFITKCENDKDSAHFAVCDDNDNYMGTVSLKDIDKTNKKAEYAIVLHPDAIGKGYADFATNYILEYAFENAGLNRVFLNVLSENIRACKFYEKKGFVFEGEWRDAVFHKGCFKNLKWYSVLKKDYVHE